MGSATVSNPTAWIPYVKNRDCSRGLCSLYCPQLCYMIFPPPPPLVFTYDSSGSNFPPLVVAIIGVLASAFLLVSYYALISKYCRGRSSATRRVENQGISVESEEDDQGEPSAHDHVHEPWHVAGKGLDDTLIKKITLLKFKKGDGLIEDTDCSVCLGEFHEDDSLRLLPKCSHAFHVACIDTWLRTHSNCPLCRANISFTNPSPLPLPTAPMRPPSAASEPAAQDQQQNITSSGQEDRGRHVVEGGSQGDVTPKKSPRASSELGNSKCDSIIEIRGDWRRQRIRRSASMDSASQGDISIAGIISKTQNQEFHVIELHPQWDVGSSKEPKPGQKNSDGVSTNSVLFTRSFSSGRFSFIKCGRRRSSIMPLVN